MTIEKFSLLLWHVKYSALYKMMFGNYFPYGGIESIRIYTTNRGACKTV